MKGYRELGNRYLCHGKRRAGLVMSSMVLATMLIYIVLTILAGFYNTQLGSVKETGNYHVEIYNTTDEQQRLIENYATVKNADHAYYNNIEFDECYNNYATVMVYLEDMEQSSFNFELVEGELPDSTSEVLLDKEDIHLFKNEIGVGDKVYICSYDENGEKNASVEFSVAGFYSREYDSVGSVDYAFTLAPEGMNLNTYVRFDTFADWDECMETMAADIGLDNSKGDAYWINGYMEVLYGKCTDVVLWVALFMLIMVFVTYMAMIMVRSLFTSNLMDKIHDFSILKSMGATDKKLKRIFKREIYIEAVISFGFGVIISHLVMFVLERTLRLYNFIFDFSVVAFILTVLFMYITISLAVIEPFSMLRKVSVIEGIKDNYVYSNAAAKKRKGRIFRIFGVEGEYAYKNIRRNSRSFWNAVASFASSVLLITVLVTCFANISKQVELSYPDGKAEETYDIYTYLYADKVSDDKVTEIRNTFLSEPYIMDADATYVYITADIGGGSVIPVKEEAKPALFSNNIDTGFAIVQLYTKEQLEKLNAYMPDGTDAASLISDGGVIVVGEYTICNQDTGETEKIMPYDVEVGDNISVVKPDYVMKQMYEGDYYAADTANKNDSSLYMDVVVKGISSNSLYNQDYPQIIMSYDYVKSAYGNEYISAMCSGFYINVDESRFNRSDFEEVVYKRAGMVDWGYLNELKWVEEGFKTAKVIVIFVVAFILMMGTISVLHNMVSEQQERRKEISILRSIGMSKKKLNRMLVLEKLIIAFIAWLIGIILGVVFARLILISILYFFEAGFVIPWGAYLITGAGLMGIMALLSMIMVVSMGRLNITDNIRNKE